GVYYDLILADIPGIIEGASEGKGLGIKFLRHVERTKVLFHLISSETEDVVGDYKVIRSEMENYKQEMLNKEEYVFVSKSDLVSKEVIDTLIKKLAKIKVKAAPLSIHDEESLKKVQTILNKIAKEKVA
ncbi:50S ribosome-binding GTPase, partial [Candidatus Parcubacteria bacterium]|nr:50S ribosome-binding GTPase [Candidatus Parcubacteria bacterium]